MDFDRLFSIMGDEEGVARDLPHDGTSAPSSSEPSFAKSLDQVTFRGITFRWGSAPSFLDLGSLGAAHQWLNDSVEAIETSPETRKGLTFLLLLRNATLKRILHHPDFRDEARCSHWPATFLGGVHLSLTEKIERIRNEILDIQGPAGLTRLPNGANALRISREAVHLSNQCVYFEEVFHGLASAITLIESKSSNNRYYDPKRKLYSLKQEFERAGSYCVGGRERCATLIRGVQIVIAQRDQEATLKLAAESTNIARASWQDTTSMTAITVITMVFLPGTFTATLFSMPWFEDLAGNGNATIQMKVYTILTVLLTAGVISGWRVWCRIRHKRRNQEISAQIDNNKLEAGAIRA
ncbi:hypothetical protein BN1723_001543 [Verticillium longisporum]|uniref:Uncharacterized protein n=1 Tax=Verticillium longisporum TaxID=100787 RepID=A0A0G4KEX5_VERLO|nr:hypothetical protein BN1723_001543 [Verticillium longisporum]